MLIIMSTQTSDNSKRIAKRRLLLYFRMQFLIGSIVVYEAIFIAWMLK